ncbi:MAG: hypothetical protein KDI46_09550 [Alphaproteobacteria bacterium]|nr:hypothetical protein [Alphaproteobacteria bacterium]
MIWSWLLSLILGIFYVFLIVPLGVLNQVFFKSKARYQYNPAAQSYWVPRPAKNKTIDMSKQS